MRLLPEHGPCFVCGSSNPHSIGIRWYATDDGAIVGTIALTDSQQGPPKLAHGGASAALLDEAMGAAVWLAGHQAAAVNLNVDYHKPLPLGAEITIRARISERSEKAIHSSGEITLPDGTIVVSAKGVYVEAKHLFTEVKFDRVQ